MRLQEIYSTFNGECNRFGIGSPAIFVRLGGCHLRCYKKTMGILCDTPLALDKKSGEEKDVTEIVEDIVAERDRTGISYITLTGGDPLWRDSNEVFRLVRMLIVRNFYVSIETSGTLDWRYLILEEFEGRKPSFVVDYKLKSAGIPKNSNLLIKEEYQTCLDNKDFIKFVVADQEDYQEMKVVVEKMAKNENIKANISVGVFWGGSITTFDLFEKMKVDGLLKRCSINMQTHKMAWSADMGMTIPEKI